MLAAATTMMMSDLDDLDRQFLVERHLISQEHAEKSPTQGRGGGQRRDRSA